MKHEIIKTENYLLVVDDSKIKDGDWCIYKTGEIIQYLVKLNTDNLKKIVAHLPLNNSPILQGVDLLPPLQDNGMGEPLVDYIFDKHNQDRVVGFIDGYNKAKEKYKYTEEDMRGFHKFFMEIGTNSIYDALTLYIQSLSQPKMPIGFECQTFDTGDDKLDGTHILGIRTTTNSQGQSVWVGKYIY